MKQTQEFDGKNLDQAIEKACSTLKVAKKTLRYDVISAGSTGIFGIVGVKKARIRVTLPQQGKGGGGTSGKGAHEKDLDGIMSIVDEAFGETPSNQESGTGPKPSEPRKKPRPRPVAKKEPFSGKGNGRFKGADSKPVPEEAASKAAPPSPEVKEERPRDNNAAKPVSGVTPEAEKEVKAPAPEVPNGDSGGQSVEEGADQQPAAPRVEDDQDYGYPPIYEGEIPVDVSGSSVDLGRETLQRMVDLITDDAVVVAETNQDRLLLKVEGGNSGVLIGRRGQTLEAMQFLTDKIINRKSDSRVRLKVDIEGYMETRKANLISLAHKMAEKAKKTGKPATINQMTAQDRRTVHLALKEDSRVRTQSMGDGYYRRLVIFPKKGSFKKRRHYRK